ncbi:hypothetical protein [Planomonospora parontospora]|uniref:hypothetical protein n=1 Tax=Planomonospora parontospora TaxID=58119 RepID=UPI00166FCA72|nr:hypothetical protein [Planomonospora parontospora]GGL04920.1 hypothetical protein GCM10014719_03870 [Planomonospora parontospora subsp. antibiotica]GII14392.1 hypothetical protein Ppa05_11180 [Planomonospora parontospora subsp. antibiotica]
MTTTKFAPGRLGAAIAAMFAGLLAILMTAPPAHAAAPDPDTIVSAWAKDPLYVESGSALTSSEQSAIRDSVKGANPPIYVAALPDGTVTSGSAAGDLITKMGTQLKSGGTEKATIALLDGKTLFAGSSSLRGGIAGRIANAAVASNDDVASGMQDFVRRVELAESGKTREAVSLDGSGGSGGSESSSSGGGSGAGVLVGILVLALAGGGGLFLYSRKQKKAREAREAAELAAVKQTVDEDVTKFGEEITALDMDVKMLADGGDHQDDWARALDSYERAKVELEAVKRPDELRGVTTALEEGRYALACVKARVNHLPLPERRSPCFFNPQHGPSVRDVRWAPPGGAVRDVPACAADAEAIERGFEPQTREVMINGQRRPYYDAGPAYQPYAYGYYGGFGDVMSGMLVGTMLGSMMGGWGMGGYGMGYGAGYQEGVSDGGGDWGGGGGGDFGGGGDWGGGDFGGGDW